MCGLGRLFKSKTPVSVPSTTTQLPHREKPASTTSTSTTLQNQTPATYSTSHPAKVIMSYPLTGKVALVTGASKGIGKSIAENLSAQGATVVINYSRDSTPADALVAQLGADRSHAIKADVSSVSESQRLVSETVAKYGKIDILVLNAGVLPNKDLAGTTEQDFDRTFGVNVKGPYFITQVRHSQPNSKAPQ